MIIVTGGAGCIGSAVIWALNKRGITDIILVDGAGHLRSIRPNGPDDRKSFAGFNHYRRGSPGRRCGYRKGSGRGVGGGGYLRPGAGTPRGQYPPASGRRGRLLEPLSILGQ